MRKIIAVDMDNVIADIETQMINWYERDFGWRVDRSQMLGKSELEAFPDKEAVRQYFFTSGFFRTAPVKPGALEAVKTLMLDYEIYIVSAAMEFPQSLFEKAEWLKEYFPFISWKNIVFCGDKSIIDTHYLIDDHCKNLDICKGKPILFTASHNIHHTHHIRVNDWSEVLELFKKELLS
jgi:5'(3')-deoxyribonucleotidase